MTRRTFMGRISAATAAFSLTALAFGKRNNTGLKLREEILNDQSMKREYLDSFRGEAIDVHLPSDQRAAENPSAALNRIEAEIRQIRKAIESMQSD